jgi:hypothetical protein
VELDTGESDDLIASDIAELSDILADHYVQSDESGKPFTKQDVLSNLKSGKVRYISMKA